MELVSEGVTYAAVAANTSTLRALVTRVRTREKVMVKSATTTRRMIMRSMKFKAIMEATGRAEDIMVLRMSAIRSALLSLYCAM